MIIWLINHYAVPPQYYPLARTTYFAKKLMEKGHEVIVFAASSVHNSSINLIKSSELFREEIVNGVRYVYVRTNSYVSNGVARILNMLEFARRLPKATKAYGKPDVVMASSATPFACMAGLRLAKKQGAKAIAEISDLWPESFVAYGLMNSSNPLLKVMYAYEKCIYQKADEIIFTMEGGKDYLIKKAWDKGHGGPVEMKKIHYINNGVDLQEYHYNKSHYTFLDVDLDSAGTFKVVYTGSVRKVNNLGILLDVAAILQKYRDKNIRILIYGDGDERELLKNQAQKRGLQNIVFKGKVDKEYVPFLLSKADLCLMHWQPSPITQYGMSMNKLFDYFASGKPILSNSISGYDLIQEFGAGKSALITSAEQYAEAILSFTKMSQEQYDTTCANSRLAAGTFDYSQLTGKLLEVMEK